MDAHQLQQNSIRPVNLIKMQGMSFQHEIGYVWLQGEPYTWYLHTLGYS